MSSLILAFVLSGCPGGSCSVPKAEKPAAVKHEKVRHHRRLFRFRLFKRGCCG